ncbi:1,3-beta-glucanosyltransferase gas1 [Mortierella sp. 14UC]|nr:1,3-beta-glucanosyltransferase gas1 [Mortierella sp. 14UC]
MVRITTLPTLAFIATVALHAIDASNIITIKGTKFFDSVTKDQFFINGVDSSQNHNECMRALEEAGMYLILDLTSSEHPIVRTSPQYNTKMWSNVRSTIEAFKGYSNTLCFFVGNEVTNDSKTTPAGAYVKALLRDTKAYIRSSASRLILVGYANNDDPEIRLQVRDYFNCGADDEHWYGEGATYQSSGHVDRTADISSYSVPVFLSEYGCNLVSPRTFPEVKSIFGPDMTNTWSGGIVYEWSQEENNFGLVQINNDNSGSRLPDFNNFKVVMSSIRPIGVNMDAYNEQRPHSACPPITATWEPSANLPLTPSSEACDCMMSSLGCIASEQALSASDSTGSEFNALCGMPLVNTLTLMARRLAFLYSQHYSSVGQSQPSSCHFNGMAVLSIATRPSDEGCAAPLGVQAAALSKRGLLKHQMQLFRTKRGALLLAVDLLNPSHALEQKTHKLKRLVQSPNSYFMDVKCPGCVQITTVFSHAQTVVMCSSCANVLAQPTGGITRLTEGCSFRRKQA